MTGLITFIVGFIIGGVFATSVCCLVSCGARQEKHQKGEINN